MENEMHGKVEILKEIVVNGHSKGFEIVFMMIKDEYKGISVYKVHSILRKDGEIIDIDESICSYSERDVENFFNLLVDTYLRNRCAKIVK